MVGEIPQNEVRTSVHIVSKGSLFLLFGKLHDDRNVLKIEHERAGADFKVTVHYAVMDLALRLAAISASIEQAVVTANDAARARS